jgi:phage-related protein
MGAPGRVAALYKNCIRSDRVGERSAHGAGLAKRLEAVVVLGRALDDLRAFPLGARRAAGHRIGRVQAGLGPDEWKPMASIGAGAREIRLREADAAFRVVSVAKRADAIFVLHCSRKTSEKTSRADLALAKRRYAGLIGKATS